MAGKPSLAAHMRRLVVVSIAVLFGAGTMLYASSHPGPARATGNSVVTVDAVGDVGYSTSLAIDSSGKPVISYYDQTNGALRLVHCGNPNCTSGNALTTPDNTGNVGFGSSLALDASGRPVVSYLDFTNTALKILRCGNVNCTSGNSITVPDPGSADIGAKTSLKLDAGQNPVVIYKRGLLHCGNATCSAGNTIAAAIGSDDASLALDSSGFPVIAYASLGLEVLHCGNATCTSGNIAAFPFPTWSGSEASVALDAAGNPAVSYHGLILVRCGTGTCSSGNSLVTPAGPGQLPSLALDAAGHPVVSYSQSGTLRMLHCADAGCTAGNSVSIVDTGNVGEDSSLALDGLGNPVVSYLDFAHGDLKLAHCGDPGCKGVVVPTLLPTDTPTATATPCPMGQMPDYTHGGCIPILPTSTPLSTPTACPTQKVHDYFGSCATPTPTSKPAAGLDFSLGIDTNSDGTDDCATNAAGSAKCVISAGTSFRLKAYLNSLPTLDFFGYASFDLYVTFSGVISKNRASSAPWPDCGFAAVFSSGGVRWGCAMGAGSSTYTGLIGTNDFTCANSGVITLIHGLFDTDIADAGGHPYHEAKKTSETLTINCVAPTPPPPALGGVADYPGVSGGSSAWGYAAFAAAIGLLTLGGTARYARRRSGR